ncbi:MAG: FtsX-like permease family protein [Candidatus Lokiarchaeota archaeon]|nr:FtsX-like permease family protein [Candidatus Lokiarchaeota archaeon]
MSLFRLINKSFLLALRSRRRFWMFTLAYALLLGFSSVFMDRAIAVNFALGVDTTMAIIAITVSALISMLYANIIVTYRKMEIATLKCIGWKNDHIRILISGEIMAVTLLAFFFVVEAFFHYTAISAYALSADISNPPFTDAIVLVQFWPIAATFGIMLGVQIAGILIANDKILKIRPIQALQKM